MSYVPDEFDILSLEYRKKFGESYGVNFGDSRPLSVHIEIMKEALRTGVPAEVPEFKHAIEAGIVI